MQLTATVSLAALACSLALILCDAEDRKNSRAAACQDEEPDPASPLSSLSAATLHIAGNKKQRPNNKPEHVILYIYTHTCEYEWLMP